MTHKQTPPVAAVIPKELNMFGEPRIDNYFWLNQRESPEVIDYLTQENKYYQENTAHTRDFQKVLFDEMKARIKEDDESVPYLYNGYYYITRFEVGKDYPVYSRKKEILDATEQILINCNELAEGHAYFQLGSMSVSPDNKLLLFSTDTVGRRIYKIEVKEIETGNVLQDCLENVTGTGVLANDNRTIFYSCQDEVTLRSDKIYKHVLGTSQTEDELVYFEKDEAFSTDVVKSKSGKYIAIESSSTLTTEYQILNADTPNSGFRVFQKRVRGVEYSISHCDNSFYIITNRDNAENFKLMITPETDTTSDNWVEVIAHRKDVLIEDIDIFKNYLVVEERSNGLNKIRIIARNGGDDYYLPFESETYTAYADVNMQYDTDVLRYKYQSMTTPSSVIDFNMKTKQKDVKKEQEVLGGKFDKNNYTEERVWATATDGTKIPISMVYKKGIAKDGGNPLLQYAYGSYGYSMDVTFSTSRLSLLDRGFIFAIAHIRGGEDLGRHWYEDGKLLKKKNTFSDFIDCSKFLISQKYTSPQHLYAEGGSAGGLLMGVVANWAPDMYNGIIAQVPFVDVVTTMLDDSIPLTTGEYDEWGNPNEREYYDYMLSYSPYDNVKAQPYPNMYISTGLHDSQVQYWEPAKWIAKLRVYNTSNNLLFLDTNMEAGHGGASGRFESMKELAKEFSFLLELEKKRE